ncbi:MAG: alpha/beta hydrolase [Anaerolineae bacterium]|nr:alpha/beta hydrolase [Anaerolineae bacterium]
MLLRHNHFPSRFVPARHVHVWLPDDYVQQPQTRYSVLYMHDGQNLFDPATAMGGETWGVAEALARLTAAGTVRPTIIVGIFNHINRWEEYWPERPLTHPHAAQLRQQFNAIVTVPVRSDNYLRFVVTEVKAFIDQAYRTLPAPEETFIMGSSMGGLISLYALCEYPEVFGGAGCLSTHWPAVEGIILPYLETALPAPGRHKLYFDYGTATLDALYEPLQKPVDALMVRKGYHEGQNWLTRRFEGAEHNEPAWRARIDLPLTFLLSQ